MIAAVAAPDDWCDVMEMLRATCVHCRPPAERRALDRLADQIAHNTPSAPRLVNVAPGPFWENGTPVAAKFSGRCPQCKETFQAGEMIRLADGGQRWIHAEECS